ncbi:2-dehydropantoate 2-reductase [Reyranella sp. CPCC 100927]|uniref:2-dehydropantoate 2-reductase n=1 Tax=Reyranella sp. CPCC 100927 TaxID=2599616 RepID=UPI0011B67F1E|nr:2-dehydropantoate 2-reductase [Reyranella sp. CPCC 100927]TWT03156.1 2-dehydropantoate 2-reductase [Reyranella sp. CPCC 100927]
MKVLILGAGALGGYFGGRLHQAGTDVTFLVRAARAEKLRADGLRIKSPKGDAALTVKAVGDGAQGGPYDLVLLSCKAYDLDSAMDAIAPAVGGDTVVVPVLNGMQHLDALDARFGRDHVVGGVARIGATLAPDGTVVHTSPFAAVSLGERDKGRAPRPVVAAFAEALTRAGIDGGLHTDIVQDMWDKWVMLGTLASMTCVMRGPVGDILAANDGEAIVRETIEECRRIAAAAGYEPSAGGIKTVESILLARGSMFAASMLYDLERGGQVEADHIIGGLLAGARTAGIAAPNLRFAYAHLQAYERRRARENMSDA